jgi:putative ABC transport system permease protein
MVLAEALLIGAVGWILGVIAGFALAAVLAYVINVAFFGWTIDWATPWTLVLQTPFWVAGAALLAAIIPAWRAANTPLAEAVRAE